MPPGKPSCRILDTLKEPCKRRTILLLNRGPKLKYLNDKVEQGLTIIDGSLVNYSRVPDLPGRPEILQMLQVPGVC